ncbi:cupin domain-containing protein [Alkalihalobacillus deserti]|uniref:cupin domain-containing protein n=1 Tax=Alkalihalobacillus deserti TaxID=2879466 RepID=UPI001D153CF3|nr:cupin domain-containing protein [Alkalihalobacillus deserti]
MNQNQAQYWITHLGLEPHPEGGFFKRSFESKEEISEKARKLYTSIYFLLRAGDVSHFHRLQSDELWYFHTGSSMSVHIIHENGDYEEAKLGLNADKGEVPQVLVPKHSIFGSSLSEEKSFSLVGCMVAPGFEYEDFELFTQKDLLNDYPQHEEIIKRLAYETIPEFK